MSASRQCHDYTAADVEDEEATAGAVQRPISLEQFLHDGAGWDRFAMIWSATLSNLIIVRCIIIMRIVTI